MGRCRGQGRLSRWRLAKSCFPSSCGASLCTRTSGGGGGGGGCRWACGGERWECCLYPLIGAGGIAGDRRKKAWQARKAARSVSADFSEQPSRRQGKRQAKRQEKRRAKAGRDRPSATVQPGAEHGNSPTTATVASGGSGNAVTTAVASKTLSRPTGRPEDLAISALNRARRPGGARGATKGQRSSNKNAAGFDNGGGSGAKGCVIEEDIPREEQSMLYWKQQQQQQQRQQQQPKEGFVQGAASPEPHARQEAEGGVTVRKLTLQEGREENEGAEKKEEETKEKGEKNGKEEETERVNARPASPQASSGAPDQGAIHAAASTDSEGRCYDKEMSQRMSLVEDTMKASKKEEPAGTMEGAADRGDARESAAAQTLLQ
ncbi:unnamed protein product [Ectocarpus sp. CCAP 1310/34]|nr:unnamed protein product [Ectocarpus sp. CCAP 1310/34]